MNIINVFVIIMVLLVSKMKANVEIKISDDEESCLTSFFYVIDHSFEAIDVSAASDGTVVALDSDGNIHYILNVGSTDYEYDYKWTKLDKPYSSMIFRDISVGSSNNIWGINNVGRSYRYSFMNSRWVSDEKSREQISAATDGSVILARNEDNNKLYYTMSDIISWKPFDSAHSWEYISVGSIDDIWAINVGGGRAYKLPDLDESKDNIWFGCSATPGVCFSQLSVGASGSVIGIDDNDDVYSLSMNDNDGTQKTKEKLCIYGISKISMVEKDNIWAIIDGEIVHGYFVDK